MVCFEIIWIKIDIERKNRIKPTESSPREEIIKDLILVV